MENISKKRSIFTIVILSISFLGMAVGTTSPALATIGQAFPNIAFSLIVLIATLPSLIMVPASLVAGKLAGKSMTYKSLVLIGIILLLIGGTAPYFMNNFTLILVMRAVLGIGLGILAPLPAALIMNIFEGKVRENMMGYNMLVSSIGGIVFQMLGGILCAINWRVTFLAHILAIIPFFIVLFLLVEPQKVEQAKGQKVNIPGMVYVWAIIFAIYEIILYPMLTGMSSLILANNLGTAASAGVVLTLFTVGVMVAGAAFGNIYRITTRFTFVTGLLIHAIGFMFILAGNSLMLYTVGATIVGIGFGIVMPAIMMAAGMLVTPDATPFVMSLTIAFMSLGGFLSGFFFAFVNGAFNITSLKFPYVFGIVCLVAYSVIHTLINQKASKTQNPSVPGGTAGM